MRGGRSSSKQVSSFFEKKEAKKLFSPLDPSDEDARAPLRRGQRDKSFFGSFFSKKELLAS
jgi:hypothetical protein